MKILVFGASGKVGRLVVKELLGRGHEVTAFVHSHDLPEAPHLNSVHGDIYDRSSVGAAIANQEIIVSALSSWGSEDKNVLSTAMQMIVPAAEKAGIRRLVSLTGDGAQAADDSVSVLKHLTHPLFNLVAPKILRDSEDHIEILTHSKLKWVVLRSPVMTNRPAGRYVLSEKSASLLIPRASVAKAMSDLAESNEYTCRAPFIRQV
jgi:putative NADH-flavin reductase